MSGASLKKDFPNASLPLSKEVMDYSERVDMIYDKLKNAERERVRVFGINPIPDFNDRQIGLLSLILSKVSGTHNPDESLAGIISRVTIKNPDENNPVKDMMDVFQKLGCSREESFKIATDQMAIKDSIPLSFRFNEASEITSDASKTCSLGASF